MKLASAVPLPVLHCLHVPLAITTPVQIRDCTIRHIPICKPHSKSSEYTIRGELKVAEWMRHHPAAMHSHLGVSLQPFVLSYTISMNSVVWLLHAISRLEYSWLPFSNICREGPGRQTCGERPSREVFIPSQSENPFHTSANR